LKGSLFSLFVVIALGISLSALPAIAVDGKLVLSGSSTLAPLISEIAKKFEKSHPGVRIDVQTGGSSRGVAEARSGLASIGMASRPLKDREKDLLKFTIAVDGVAPLLNVANPVQNLTRAQLKGILTGRIKNWKDVGGNDEPIVVANRAEGRSELGLVTAFLGIKPSEIKAHLIVGENSHGIKTISRNKRAMTYLSVGHALKEIEFGSPVKLVSLDGVKPSFKTVSSGKFPLARPLNLITKEMPSGLKKAFIDYAKSKSVADIIVSQSFVPVSN